MPRLYRKRPVTVEAVQYLENRANIGEVIDFLIQGKVHHLIKQEGIIIRTLEGDMLAVPGDYIIKGIKSEFYPCKSQIFEASYEPLL